VPKWKNVTSAFSVPRAISSCALRIGDDGVTERQPSGTAKVNASTFTVSAREIAGKAKKAKRAATNAVLMTQDNRETPE
jgi:hypothetical protein